MRVGYKGVPILLTDGQDCPSVVPKDIASMFREISVVASRPRHARPPLSLHVDKERLLDIIRTENPEFYEFLAPHGYDKIEHIRIFCYLTDDNPERVHGFITVKFPCPVFYEIPRNDDPVLKEEEDRVLWWMYYKDYSRFKKKR